MGEEKVGTIITINNLLQAYPQLQPNILEELPPGLIVYRTGNLGWYNTEQTAKEIKALPENPVIIDSSKNDFMDSTLMGRIALTGAEYMKVNRYFGMVQSQRLKELFEMLFSKLTQDHAYETIEQALEGARVYYKQQQTT